MNRFSVHMAFCFYNLSLTLLFILQPAWLEPPIFFVGGAAGNLLFALRHIRDEE